jgi:hypothetical protein
LCIAKFGKRPKYSQFALSLSLAPYITVCEEEEEKKKLLKRSSRE